MTLLVRFFDTFLFRGTLRKLPQRAADLAHLQPGEAMLDVGCGTGALALVVKERVGETGLVCGIDPGPQQITPARSKAERVGLPIDFQVFFQLPGRIFWGRTRIEVELKRFNDCTLNRDL